MIKRILVPTTVLYVLWLLLSGHFEPFMLAAGAALSLGIAFFANYLGVFDPRTHSVRFSLRLFKYIPWLFKEVVKSNLAVTRLVWKPKIPISPTVIDIPASQRSALGLAVHANSITLTPGTLSIEAREGNIEVHALAHEFAESLQSGEMDRRVRALEGA